MKSLEAQWLEHKTPLVKQLEDLRLQASSRQATIEQKLSELQQFKQQMKASSEENKLKDEQIKTLVSLVCRLLVMDVYGGSSCYSGYIKCVCVLGLQLLLWHIKYGCPWEIQLLLWLY